MPEDVKTAIADLEDTHVPGLYGYVNLADRVRQWSLDQTCRAERYYVASLLRRFEIAVYTGFLQTEDIGHVLAASTPKSYFVQMHFLLF